MHTTFCLPVTKRKILTSNHLLSEHHLAKLYGIFVPESHIMTALAFKIYVLCAYAVKEQVELPVFSQKKILCSAGHEYLGKPAAFVKSFRQHLGIGCRFIVSTNLLSSTELFSTLKTSFFISNLRLCSSE